MPMHTKLHIPALFVTALLVVAVSGEALAQRKVVRPAPADPGEWTMIGEVTANFRADHDTLVVRGAFDDFRRIKFSVADAPVNIKHLVVTYDNGEPDQIPVRAHIQKGGESRVIDLRGGKRSIRRIEFWYDTAGGRSGRSHIIVFGRK